MSERLHIDVEDEVFERMSVLLSTEFFEGVDQEQFIERAIEREVEVCESGVRAERARVGDASVVARARQKVKDAFSSSAAMPGNEEHFEDALSEYEKMLGIGDDR